jgi:N-methylhydantoinase B
VEANDHAYPMRYLWRRERPDSGGPGRRRGGIGSTFAYAAHEAGDPVELTLFAHGVSHPTSAGVLGGEPGSQHGFLILRADDDRAWAADPTGPPDGVGEVPAAKSTAVIDGDDVMVSWCAGGGGLGDPLERPPGEVAEDVRQGLVTPAGADRDYGVVLAGGPGSWAVDVGATEARRLAARRARLGGADPAPAAEAVPGRWFGSALVLDGDTVVCRRCGHRLGPASANLRTRLRLEERPVERRWPLAGRARHDWRLVVRHYFCPACARQLDVEVAPPGEPPLWASQLDPDQPRSPSDGGDRR